MLLATASPHSTMRTLRKMSIAQVAFVDPGIGGAAPTDATTTSAHDSRSILCVWGCQQSNEAPLTVGTGTMVRLPWWQYTEVRACSTIAVVTPSGHGAPGDRQITIIAAWCIYYIPRLHIPIHTNSKTNHREYRGTEAYALASLGAQGSGGEVWSSELL